jgi:hypothetical protein
MNKNEFTANEIRAILRECRGLANIELEIGNLKISYHPQGPGDAAYQSQVAGHARFKRESNEIPSQWKEQANLMDEQALQEVENSRLVIEDPFGFEQMQIDHHIEQQRVTGDGRNESDSE